MLTFSLYFSSSLYLLSCFPVGDGSACVWGGLLVQGGNLPALFTRMWFLSSYLNSDGCFFFYIKKYLWFFQLFFFLEHIVAKNNAVSFLRSGFPSRCGTYFTQHVSVPLSCSCSERFALCASSRALAGSCCEYHSACITTGILRLSLSKCFSFNTFLQLVPCCCSPTSSGSCCPAVHVTLQKDRMHTKSSLSFRYPLWFACYGWFCSDD